MLATFLLLKLYFNKYLLNSDLVQDIILGNLTVGQFESVNSSLMQFGFADSSLICVDPSSRFCF